MRKLLCASSNNDKFSLGQAVLARHGIELEQIVIDIDEIQGEEPELIVRRKAHDAFEKVGEPVVVTDDCWSIPALGGFPGPYMKSLNHWLSAEDFLHLADSLTDRTIVLQQLVAYCDEHETVVFRKDIPGTLLTELKGATGPVSQRIIALDIDNGLTVAEVFDKGISSEPHRLTVRGQAWEELGEWLEAKES
jgi:XTP/dITP diphosphohydrolase